MSQPRMRVRCSAGPVAKDASAPAPPVEQGLELLDRRAVVAQDVSDQIGVVSAASQEEVGIRVERTDLRP